MPRGDEGASALRRPGRCDRDLQAPTRPLDSELREMLAESVERLHRRAVESSRELGDGSLRRDVGGSSHEVLDADLGLARKILDAASYDELDAILISSIMTAEGLLAELRQILSVARVALESLRS